MANQPEQDPYGIVTQGFGENNNRIITRGYQGFWGLVKREIIRLKSRITTLLNYLYAFINSEIERESEITTEIKKKVNDVVTDVPIKAESEIARDINKKSFISRVIRLKNKIRKKT